MLKKTRTHSEQPEVLEFSFHHISCRLPLIIIFVSSSSCLLSFFVLLSCALSPHTIFVPRQARQSLPREYSTSTTFPPPCYLFHYYCLPLPIVLLFFQPPNVFPPSPTCVLTDPVMSGFLPPGVMEKQMEAFGQGIQLPVRGREESEGVSG
eukprot:760955-Hanusia_phi.AAC.5